MISDKHFNGVTHNIAHHAQSSLSWMHPHLGEACQKYGTDKVSIILHTRPATYPTGFPISEPLKLATESLQNKIDDIIESVQLEPSEVETMILNFVFPPHGDNYLCSVESELKLSSGKIYIHKVE